MAREGLCSPGRGCAGPGGAVLAREGAFQRLAQGSCLAGGAIQKLSRGLFPARTPIQNLSRHTYPKPISRKPEIAAAI